MWDTSPVIERVQLPEWSGNREMAWPPYRPPVLPASCFPGFYPAVPWVEQREEEADQQVQRSCFNLGLAFRKSDESPLWEATGNALPEIAPAPGRNFLPQW